MPLIRGDALSKIDLSRKIKDPSPVYGTNTGSLNSISDSPLLGYKIVDGDITSLSVPASFELGTLTYNIGNNN